MQSRQPAARRSISHCASAPDPVEALFDPIPYDDPAWSDPDRWETGPAVPRSARFTPREAAGRRKGVDRG
jgi:hypothetical protein